MDVLVTRKGQITIPVALRRKHGIEEGMRVAVEDSPSGIVLKVVPNFIDLIGVDSAKFDLEKTLKQLDKMRSEDRY